MCRVYNGFYEIYVVGWKYNISKNKLLFDLGNVCTIHRKFVIEVV